MGFLSAVEDLKRRSGFKAIAYSKLSETRTAHGFKWNMPTQQAADKEAMEVCEKLRANVGPVCTLLDPKVYSGSAGVTTMQAAPVADSSATIESKLSRLKDLLSKGLISQELYDKQVAELLQKI